jgi:hypothetical protein
MSAGPGINQTQACVRSALADEVVAVGGIAAAAAEIGASDDTCLLYTSPSPRDQ